MRDAPALLVLGLGMAICGCSPPLDERLPAHTIQVVAGEGQVRAAGLAVRVPPAVRVTDAYGWPVAGVQVVFSALPAARAAASVSTDGNGLAVQPSWSLRRDGGDDTLVAAVDGVGRAEFHAVSGNFASVAVGVGAACALARGGRTLCWGGYAGRVAVRADTLSFRRPQLLPDTNHFRTIATSFSQTCGLTASGSLLCQGTIVGASQMQDVSEGHRYVELVMGDLVRCAVTTTGRAFCFGSNVNRRGADGRLHPWEIPALAPFTHVAVSVVSGAFGPAGAACTLDTSGHSRCWSANGVTPFVSDTGRYEGIAAGANFGCGLSQGQVRCWGSNIRRSLGVDGPVTSATVPIPPAKAIAAAFVRACAATDVTVFCWGADQLPAPVPGSAGLRLRQLSMSETNVCGVDDEERAWCWGDNSAGQLGDGTLRTRVTPGLVSRDF